MLQKKIISLSNGLHITVEVENARYMKITPLLNMVEERDDDNDDICRLNYINEFKVTINEDLVLDKQVYKPLLIRKVEDNVLLSNGYYIYLHEINKSTNFIMPLLSPDNTVTRQDFKWIYLCNCYIGTENDADYGEFIYLLYRFSGDRSFFDFDKKLCSMSNFTSKTDVDQFHILYKFDVDPFLKEDYDLIVKGKYSKISEESKQRILRFHYLANTSPTYDVFYKTESRRKYLENELEVSLPDDLELYDLFKFDEEIYLDKYRINKNIIDEFKSENPDYC